MHYAFDAHGIGPCDGAGSIWHNIPRPIGLSTDDWSLHAQRVCTALNSALQCTPAKQSGAHSIVIQCDSAATREVVAHDLLAGVLNILTDGSNLPHHDNYTGSLRYSSPEPGMVVVVDEEPGTA